jgi:CRP/FNR family transcriptional regulator
MLTKASRPAAPASARHPTRPPHAEDGDRPASCSTCDLRTVCWPRDPASDARIALAAFSRTERKLGRGAAVYREGEAFDSLFMVRQGVFKSVRVSRSGDEKVIAFHVPGEIFGLDAIGEGRHMEDAIALEESAVCVIPYASLVAEITRSPVLQSHMFRVLSAGIARNQGVVLMTEMVDAERRVYGFLSDLSCRYEAIGQPPDRIPVGMTRREIASYLGLSHETVSRILGRAARSGLLAVAPRAIEIRDLEALKRAAEI